MSDQAPLRENPTEAEPAQIGAGINFSDPNSPLAAYYLRTSHVIAAALLAFVFFYFGVITQLAQTDIWGHLKYGEWIVQQRAWPEHELFSPFADQDPPYWNFQWLAQVIFYLCYHAGEMMAGGDEIQRTAGGVEMLRTLHGLLIALKAGFVMLAIRRATRSLPLALVGTVLYILLAHSFSRIERPQLFGEVFFACLLWWLSGKQLARSSVVVVPLLFVLWANTHGSFGVGFLLFFAVCAGQVIALAWRPRRSLHPAWWTSSWLWQGGAALLLSMLAVSFLNPHGIDIYNGIAQVARHPNIRTVVEWKPMDFSQPTGGHWIYLGTLAGLALAQAVSPRPLPLSRVFVLAAFGLGPLYQQRLIVWWVMVMPWLLMTLVRDSAVLVPRFWRGFRSIPSLRKTLMAVLIVGIGVSWSGCFSLLIGRAPLPLQTSATRTTLWPMALQLKSGAGMPPLAAALQNYPNKAFRGRIFVQDMLADYLVWSLPEKAPVLIYNHAHLFPESIWQDQITILSGRPGWNAILDRYEVNLVVFDPQMCTELAEKIRADPDWAVVVDEGHAGASETSPTVFNGKLFVALRKNPIGPASSE